MNRRYLSLFLSLVLCAMAATTAGASEKPVTVGTADTVLELLSVELSGLPVGGVNLGGFRSFASTDTNTTYNPMGKPFALASLELPDGSKQQVRSDGDGGREGSSVPVAGVGTLTLGNVTAEATGQTAQSIINAVEGNVDAVVAGLKAKAAGVQSQVTGERAATANGAVVENLSIGLTDVLPADILALLPLDKLIGIVDGLGLPIDLGVLDGGVDSVRALGKTVAEIVDAEAKVTTARAQLAEARKGGSAPREAVDRLSAEIAGLESEIAARNTEIAALDHEIAELRKQLEELSCTLLPQLCADTQAALDAAEGQRAAAAAARSAAQSELTTKRAEYAAAKAALDTVIATLEQTVDTLVDTLDALLAKLPGLVDKVVALDLAGLLEALVAGLEGAELIGIDRITTGVMTMADAGSSSASATCEITGARILGEARNVATCKDVSAVLAGVEDKLTAILSTLPIKGVIPADLVTITGPRTSASKENAVAEGYHVASARVSGLGILVKPVQLTQVVDGLVAEVRALVDGTLADIGLLPDLGVDLAAVESALDGLLAELDGLPVGDLLNGLTTPRVAVNALDVASRSTYMAVAGTGTPVTGGTPGSTVPGSLPETGGGVGTTALLLLGAGGALWAGVRGRREVLGIAE